MSFRIFLIFSLIAIVFGSRIPRAIHSGGCPKNAVYKECTNLCPAKSCQNYMQVSGCFSLRCAPPGCICKEGHVLLNSADSSQGCVPRETCSKLAKIQNATTTASN
ncbi:unnamed protein product [Caenorhabditis angaria]|uniref:TIL domain-containing protein n=1 Tax=Caenorhabditis angaria TaxID=860376 RepID=A0A9P1ILF1_9PELO|nr:unnamed protein product [Caenorhabditis angaria]